jgi:transposase InsO family protein
VDNQDDLLPDAEHEVDEVDDFAEKDIAEEDATADDALGNDCDEHPPRSCDASIAHRPNERWQSDARDLPWYVLYNGKPHRVTLIIVYDDYSRYIIWWRLVVKQEKEDAAWIATPGGQRHMGLMRKKGSRSSTFTGLDVIRLYLTAMYRTGVRPERIYTDNGSQFIAAEKYLLLLTRVDEPPIEVSHTRPAKPWGRGKVENSLGQLNRLLRRLPGTYNKRDRKSIRDAMHHKELYTVEEAESELAKHFKELNERPRKKASSRFDVWRSVPSLPAPPIRQMALIEDIAVEQREVTVTGWSISFDGCQWEPKSLEGKNRQIYRRWMDAAASEEMVLLCAVRLDTGWKVEARLGDLWIELVPMAEPTALT